MRRSGLALEDGLENLRRLVAHGWPAEASAALPAEKRRAPRPLELFYDRLHQTNEMLLAEDAPQLLKEELVAGRLYTGPMYMKCAPCQSPSLRPGLSAPSEGAARRLHRARR